MALWEEEKIQNDKARERQEDDRLDNDRGTEKERDAKQAEKHDGKLLDRLFHGDDQGVDNGTSAWTATEKDD